jgi:hypothetical protein
MYHDTDISRDIVSDDISTIQRELPIRAFMLPEEDYYEPIADYLLPELSSTSSTSSTTKVNEFVWYKPWTFFIYKSKR